MTVATETCFASLSWTGVESSFSPGFSALSKSHIVVTYTDAGGNVSTLTDGVQITLAHAGTDGDPGAITATPATMPAAPGTVSFERVTPAIQSTNFQDLVKYSANVHELLHDAAAMRSAENRRKADAVFDVLADATAEAVIATAQAAASAASAAAAALSAANLQGTSATSLTPSSGSKSLTTQGGKSFDVGRDLLVVSASDPANIYFAGKSTAYNSGTGALTINSAAFAGAGAHTDWLIYVAGAQGAIGPQGPASVPDRMARVLDTSNSDPATSGYTNGATFDGVTVATGDIIMRNSASNQARNGLWVVVASGAAARHVDFDTWNELVGVTVVVEEGTIYADTLWICTSNLGGTLNTTAITWAQVNSIASNSDITTGTDNTKIVTPLGAATNLVAQGLHEIGHWPARALKPATTNGAAALATNESSTNKVNDEYLGFVNASTAYAGFSFRAPKKLDTTQGFKLEFEWTEHSGASAHDCKWQVEMQAQSDADTIDSAWGTAVTVVDTGSSGTRRFALTGTITPAGSWAAGDKIHVRVSRLGADGADTLDVDAQLIGVTLFATVNAKNDA